MYNTILKINDNILFKSTEYVYDILYSIDNITWSLKTIKKPNSPPIVG